ncbi:LPS-assembly protein LptD [Phenylobacterium sp.]|jgi:LPS-assembly protein|uniref:LPS-assembly protein LptD n=1 Tax=Phenylobacterium sp. TaxID=1871053 RepID=UPI002F95D757
MPSKAKRALLAGAAVAAAWAHGLPLHAQAASPAPAAAAAPDGLAPGELYLEADEIVRDDENKITTATGNVEVRYEGRTLRSDRMIYEEGEQAGQGVIRARGNVQIINDDGSVEFADEFVLDDEMRAGVALGFSARMQENIKVAAASAARRNENVQELRRAIYTPCEICAADGSPKTPTWSIAAERVIQDKKRRLVYYRNARMRVFGATVLYLPVFWHADPQAPRTSGFLVPHVSASDRRGLSYEQPYYWAISPYSDLVISPQINTSVNPFLNGQYRRRFYSGDIDFRFGYTYEQDFDGRGDRFGETTHRSYILGRGSFRPTEKWRWGFTAERASDDLIFDKYEIGDAFESRGPYVADDRRLISQLYAIRQDRRSYASVAAMSIQGLRRGGDETNSLDDDNDRTFPLIAPLIETHYEPLATLAGGRLRFHGSAVALTREQAPLPLGTRLPGIDSRRVTGEVDWQRTFTSQAGLRVEPFVTLRADAYSLSDVLTGVGAETTARNTSRALATAGATVSYPVFRRFKDSTVVLEPVVQAAVSPNAKQVVVGRRADGSPVYLNEDTVAFEFDETTLFRANKFPGFDLYEDGARLNVAGRASVLWDDGRRANLLVGRSFRSEENAVFSARSGLRQKASDWIVAADAQPVRGVSVFARTRLDSDSLDIHRLEAGANVNRRWGSGFVRYFTDDLDINADRRENLDLGGELYLRKNWGVSFYGNRDLQQEAWVIRDAGVFYRDDCLRVDVIYRREDTVIGRLGPSDSINVRLTLATLGGPLYGR